MAGKPVCKYFRQGRCRFGADCRFYHPTGNDDSNDRGWGRPGNSRSGGYEQSTNDFNRGWGSKQSGNRFQLFSENDAGGGISQNRDNGQRRNLFDRLGPMNTISQDSSTDKSSGGWQGSNQRRGQNQWSNQDRWSNHRGGQNQWSNQRGQQDRWSNHRGGQNQWSNQRGQQDRWNNHRGGQNQWNGGQDRNSRDDRRGHSQQGNDPPTTPKEIAEIIRQDMEEWVTSKMWPLSCYAYYKDVPCIDGFTDISTHELRWEAYQAIASGNTANYVQRVDELGQRQMEMKKQFSSITADDVQSMKSGALFGGSAGGGGSSLFIPASQSPSLFSNSVSSKSSVFASSPTGPTVSSMFGGQSLFGSMQPTHSVTVDSTPLTSLFPSQPASQTLNITRAATQPSTTTSQATAAPASLPSASSASSLEDIINATKTRQLTTDELDAYNIDKFVLGCLPEHAPPVV